MKKLRFQEPEVPVLVAFFYALHPEHKALVWPGAPSAVSVRGLEGREEGEKMRQIEGQTMWRREVRGS